jgi:hypothetical protein
MNLLSYLIFQVFILILFLHRLLAVARDRLFESGFRKQFMNSALLRFYFLKLIIQAFGLIPNLMKIKNPDIVGIS